MKFLCAILLPSLLIQRHFLAGGEILAVANRKFWRSSLLRLVDTAFPTSISEVWCSTKRALLARTGACFLLQLSRMPFLVGYVMWCSSPGVSFDSFNLLLIKPHTAQR
ncbi:hypothetical protein BJ878DRAFT_72188 [Calycina marina]|uniref:Secreted protein n=1 Tax=Calycina marina TaxID=1763456 RepID=A0A9P8CF35_9HELO|nr:hypothetical protein BJ878DRAFT_72188 [Calycina marina]